MAGIRTCDRESQVQRPNHYTTETPYNIMWEQVTEYYTIIMIRHDIVVHRVASNMCEGNGVHEYPWAFTWASDHMRTFTVI